MKGETSRGADEGAPTELPSDASRLFYKFMGIAAKGRNSSKSRVETKFPEGLFDKWMKPYKRNFSKHRGDIELHLTLLDVFPARGKNYLCFSQITRYEGDPTSYLAAIIVEEKNGKAIKMADLNTQDGTTVYKDRDLRDFAQEKEGALKIDKFFDQIEQNLQLN